MSFCFVFIHLNITLKTKIVLFGFIEFRILRYVLHCSIFFRARLENPKINKRGVLITAGSREGSYCFYKKIKWEGAFIRDLKVDFMQRNIKRRFVAPI